jgi:hypothetical protein
MEEVQSKEVIADGMYPSVIPIKGVESIRCKDIFTSLENNETKPIP